MKKLMFNASIANEEIDVQRERHVDADGEKGVTHG